MYLQEKLDARPIFFEQNAHRGFLLLVLVLAGVDGRSLFVGVAGLVLTAGLTSLVELGRENSAL